MLLPIISAVVCLAAATIMYTPRLRGFQHYRPVAQNNYPYIISPDNVVMEIIHYIGIIVLGIYFVISVFFSAGRKSRARKKDK